MSQPAKAAFAAGATRLRERLSAWAIDHRVALGVLFLAVCGWKLTVGLEHVLDLRLGDETKYLAMATGYLSGPLRPEWSPLYVYFYKFEHLFEHDPVRLFFLHQKLVATLLPIGFFLFLAARSVPFLAALVSAVYLLISIADLPVGPKTLHLALTVMFLAMAAFLRLGTHPARWGLLVAACGLLSLIRAEFLIPLAAVTAYALYLSLARRRPDWPLLASIAGGLLGVTALFAWFGSPLFGQRSTFAFAQHFALNYVGWENLHQDPWVADYNAIFHRVFGEAQSIPAAFVANPPAFLHHVLTNLVHTPIVLAGLFFGHFNLFLPRFEGFTLAEAAIFAVLFLSWLAYRLRGTFAGYWQAPGLRHAAGGRLAASLRLANGAPDVVCLVIFLAPFAIMMAVLYPRYHYALAFGTILLALALIAAAPHLRGLELGGRVFLALPLLLAIVPSLGSAGVRVDRTLGTVRLVPLPALATVNYLRSLGIRTPAVILQSQLPGVGAYLGRNFSEIEEEQKTGPLRDFIGTNGISIVVADERMRHDPRYMRDPEWTAFEAAPESLGFTAHPLRDSGVVIYIKHALLQARRPAPPRSP